MNSNRTPLEAKIHLDKEVLLEAASVPALMAFKTNSDRVKEDKDKDKEGKTPLEIYLTNLRKCSEAKTGANEVHLNNKSRGKT